MTKKENQIGLLKKEERHAVMNKIMTFFQEERDEEIGIIAAEEYLDFFLDEIGGHIYNKGLRDANTAVEKAFQNLKMDIDLLEK